MVVSKHPTPLRFKGTLMDRPHSESIEARYAQALTLLFESIQRRERETLASVSANIPKATAIREDVENLRGMRYPTVGVIHSLGTLALMAERVGFEPTVP